MAAQRKTGSRVESTMNRKLYQEISGDAPDGTSGLLAARQQSRPYENHLCDQQVPATRGGVK
jgi:hypothetical protein